MRYKKTDLNFYKPGGIVYSGISLSGPLYLSSDPDTNLGIATKQYVDYKISNIDTSIITNGVFLSARLPAFQGDLGTSAGSESLSLASSGVFPGTYSKVTVSSKGIVTNGSQIQSLDMPNINWDRIFTGKPTTLTGYGITDSISKNGSDLTGFLTLHSDPVNNLHPCTKQYIDNVVAGASAYAVGDIIRKTTNVTPIGFLRCNGAYISQSSYSGLYSVIGKSFDQSSYVSLGYTSYIAVGSGRPWVQQYETTGGLIITSGTLASSVTLPAAISLSQAIVTKNRVYVIGGFNGTGYVSSVYSSAIETSSGLLTSFTTETSFPIAVASAQTAVIKNTAFVFGGIVSGSASAAVYSANINADGTLGTWVNSSNMPGGLSQSQVLVTKNRVYLLGGFNGSSFVATVYSAPINTDGTLGTWITDTPLPGIRGGSHIAVTLNRVHLIGGKTGVSNAVNTVITAPINTDGTIGTWTASTNFPVQITSGYCVVSRSHIILLGGLSSVAGNTAITTRYINNINTDGTLGTWTTITPALSAAINSGTTICTSSSIFFLATRVGTNLSSICYRLLVNNTLIGNDYTLYYNGTINKFDGSDSIYSGYSTSNPNPSYLFSVPDYAVYDTNNTNMYSYIKY